MQADQTLEPTIGWRDLVAGDRLPRFALVCAGTWLNAADELMTATVMPSVARDIGGYAWFGWAVAAFLLGSILGGATAGRLSARFGLRTALAIGAVAYSLGCAASALSPAIGWFLFGRLLQGLGGGWVAGLCYVAVASLFPQGLWARVFSSLSGVWGAATLVSPLIGGLFAEAGIWRGAFWLFAAQGLLFVAASAMLVGGAAKPDRIERRPPPYLQVLILTLAVIGIGAAGLWPSPAEAAASAVLGLGLFALFLKIDAGSPSHLLPRTAADPRTAVGAGLLMMFSLQAATVAFSVYGPALMQAIRHIRPVAAGYILGVTALSWTAAAISVAGRGRERFFIRLGPIVVTAAIAGLALAFPQGRLWLIAACALAMGAGFGMCWSLSGGQVVANTPENERAFASGSMPTAQMVGAAVGAATAEAIANLIGFGHGVTAERASLAGFWLFAAFLPLAGVGCLAAWRLAAFDANPSQSVGPN